MSDELLDDHPEFDEPLERALHRLRAASPDSARSRDAVAAALAKLQSPASTDFISKKKNFRRWLMPAGFAAAAATIVFAFWFSVVTPTSTASAAEVLREAIARRANFDGSIDIEKWDEKANRWIPHGRAFPSLGRSIHWGDENSSVWSYDDWKQKIQAEYHPKDKAVYIANILGTPSRPQMPFDEQTLLDEATLKTSEWSNARQVSGNEVHLLLTHNGTPTPVPVPNRVRVILSQESGLIQSVYIAMKAEDQSFMPVFRYQYKPAGVTPEQTWENLPVPDGTKRIDNRLTPDVLTWLATRDELYEKGLGFETAVVVSYFVDPFGKSPMVPDEGTIIIYAGNQNRWLRAQWNVGKDKARLPLPLGWPNPKFDDVMKVVGATRPHHFTAFDGKTLWPADGQGNPSVPDDASKALDRWRSSGSVQSLIWPHSSDLVDGAMGALYTKATIEETWPEKRRILTFTRPVRWQENPSELVRIESTRLDFVADPASGPWVETQQDIRYGHRGEDATEITQLNFDMTSVIRFREVIRVPTLWRRVVLNMATSPAYTEFTRLIPVPKQTVPQEWFGDPIKAWPVSLK
jgi:hypothetical protein